MPRRRPGKKLFKSLLPILLVVLVALLLTLGSIVYGITRPTRRSYLVTPESFSQISGSALKVTDETWRNHDGTSARGWLLRGTPGRPAVVFQHKYGADRSWLFNLGIKLNEATGFTILWPDLRAHGMNAPVRSTTFGTRESDDLVSAIDFLASLKGDGGESLVGSRVGVYGVELGAYTAARAARQDARIQVLVLDSVPRDADEIINAAVRDDVGLQYKPLLWLARAATRAYFMGQYGNVTTCELAGGLRTQRVLLLAGAEERNLRDSTVALQECFSNRANVEVKTDLPLTGMTLPSATGEQGERYDRPVIDFFSTNLN
jgi:pimeloyl-ACP methyl ester carboxylesterase